MGVKPQRQTRRDLQLRWCSQQTLVVAASVTTLTSEQTLIPTAARFHIGYGDQRLLTRMRGNVTRSREDMWECLRRDPPGGIASFR